MKRFLVTAGNTRERIDHVRDWGNAFTGNTGYAIARALTKLGQVDLLTSNGQHLAEVESHLIPKLSGGGFTTHAELLARIEALMKAHKYDAIVMTAAVADYRPARTYAITSRETLADGTERWTVRDAQAEKIKSNHKLIAIVGEPTEKIVDLFRTRWAFEGTLVKFKLEVGIGVEELIRIGQVSRQASGANYLVANTLDMVAGQNPGAYLLGDSGSEWIARDELPKRLVAVVGGK